MLGKRRLARRSTESGFQEFWEAVRPRALSRQRTPGSDILLEQRDEGEEYKPARRSRLWRVF